MKQRIIHTIVLNSLSLLFAGSLMAQITVLDGGKAVVGDSTLQAPLGQLHVTRATNANYQTILSDAPSTATAFSSTFAGLYVSNSQNTDGNYARFNFGDGHPRAVASIASNIRSHSNDGGTLEFWTRPATGGSIYQRMTILDNGNIGINKEAPIARLHLHSPEAIAAKIESSGATARLEINHTSGNNAGVLLSTGGVGRYSVAAAQSNAGAMDFYVYNTVAKKASLLIDGDTHEAKFLGPIYSNGALLTSDTRLKKNIRPYTAGLENIMRINPISFIYKSSIDRESGIPETFIGVSAQDMQQIEPSIVRSIDHDTDKYLHIQADAIQYMLVNAIKEQQEIIEAKDAEIKELQKQMQEVRKALQLDANQNTNIPNQQKN